MVKKQNIESTKVVFPNIQEVHAVKEKAKNNKNNKNKPNKNYSLIREIRKNPRYKNNVQRRDREVRKLFEKEGITASKNMILPGQLISFNYLTPKTKEELEYYDAMPVTIFFNTVETKEGKRVLGFNIHYYPPRIRYQIMDRIMEIWKPMYLKVWDTGIHESMTHFDYRWLIQQLEDAGLGFGVRMYIPELITKVVVVQPALWENAVFTEGVFKKKTREAILKYWLNFTKKRKS